MGAPSALMEPALHLPPAVEQASRLPILRSMQRTVERFEKKIAEKHASTADAGRKKYTGHSTISAGGAFAPADEAAQKKALLRPETSQGFMRYLLDREQGKAKAPISSYVSEKKTEKAQNKQERGKVSGTGDRNSGVEKPKGRRLSAAERRASFAEKLDMAVGDDEDKDAEKLHESGWNSPEKKKSSDQPKLSKRMTGKSPKNGFGVFATVHQVQELAAMFDEVDGDGSGEIDKHELLRILDRNPSLHINQNALYALDHDMSGGVSLGEYFHFLLPQVPRHVVHQMVEYVHAEKKRRQALEDEQHMYVFALLALRHTHFRTLTPDCMHMALLSSQPKTGAVAG